MKRTRVKKVIEAGNSMSFCTLSFLNTNPRSENKKPRGISTTSTERRYNDNDFEDESEEKEIT